MRYIGIPGCIYKFVIHTLVRCGFEKIFLYDTCIKVQVGRIMCTRGVVVRYGIKPDIILKKIRQRRVGHINHIFLQGFHVRYQDGGGEGSFKGKHLMYSVVYNNTYIYFFFRIS